MCLYICSVQQCGIHWSSLSTLPDDWPHPRGGGRVPRIRLWECEDFESNPDSPCRSPSVTDPPDNECLITDVKLTFAGTSDRGNCTKCDADWKEYWMNNCVRKGNRSYIHMPDAAGDLQDYKPRTYFVDLFERVHGLESPQEVKDAAKIEAQLVAIDIHDFGNSYHFPHFD